MATAAEVADLVAAKLNDPSQGVYTDAVLLPFFNIANNELQILLELNNIPWLKEKSTTIDVDADDTEIDTPSDFIEPIQVWERIRDSTSENDWFPVKEEAWIPEGEQLETIQYYCWQNAQLLINSPSLDREVKLYYRRTLTPFANINVSLEIADSQVWMAERIAQMIESDVMNSPSKALLRDPKVREAEQKFITKLLKNSQGLGVRRRPYRGYGMRRIV